MLLRMKIVGAALVLAASLIELTQAEELDLKVPPFSFATVARAAEILTRRDDFIQRLSPFDRSVRLKTDQLVSENAYLNFVAANVLPWSEHERASVAAAVTDVWERIQPMGLPWPQPIHLIRTTGDEEGGAPYTRDNAIILPNGSLASNSKQSLRKLVAHELFHVLTRHNPALKEKLYAAIGFMPCGELVFPPNLEPIKITNPDAPKNDFCIRLSAGGKQFWAVPILFSRTASYDPRRHADLFSYLKFQFLVLHGSADVVPSIPDYDHADPRLLDVDQVSGFFEQVGRNTQYIIHPEEILAENFVLLLFGNRELPSPAVLRRLREILAHARVAEPDNRRLHLTALSCNSQCQLFAAIASTSHR
jgi:hypothetical protein